MPDLLIIRGEVSAPLSIEPYDLKAPFNAAVIHLELKEAAPGTRKCRLILGNYRNLREKPNAASLDVGNMYPSDAAEVLEEAAPAPAELWYRIGLRQWVNVVHNGVVYVEVI